MRTSELNNLLSMLTSVAVWSFYPLLALLVLDVLPSVSLVLLVYLTSLILAVPITFPYRKKLYRLLTHRKNRRLVLLLFANGVLWAALHYALYTALKSTEKVVAIITYETWPVLLILLGPVFFGGRFKKLSLTQWMLTALAFVGVILATIEKPADILSGQALSGFAHPGIIFAFAAAMLQALNTAIFAKAADRFHGMPVFPAAVAAETLGRLASVPTLLLVIATTEIELNLSGLRASDWLVITSIGTLVFALGSALYTKALADTKSASITVLWYFVPVLSVFFLAVFGFDELTLLAVVGVGLVVISNLFLSTGSALPNSTIGAIIILFLAFYATFLGTPIEIPHIFTIIEITSLFFAILVTFLMDRLREISKTREQLQIDVNSEMNQLIDIEKFQGVFGSEAHMRSFFKQFFKAFIEADHTSSRIKIAQLQRDLLDMIDGVRETAPDINAKGDRERISRLISLEKSVVNWFTAKRQKMSVGEIIAVFLLGAFTSVTVFLGRPDTLFGDIFGIVVSTSVVFVSLQLAEYSRGVPNRDLEQNVLFQTALHRAVGVYWLPAHFSTKFGMSENGFDVEFGETSKAVSVEPEDTAPRVIGTVVIGLISAIFVLLIMWKHQIF